jgi:hypothetical protein
MYVSRPFCGSANIVRANQQRLRIAMIWVTALLLALPRVALPCGCHSAAQNKDAQTAGEAGQHCQHGCCHAHRTSRPQFRVVCAIVRSMPIELTSSAPSNGCPANCPCRLQHAQQHVGLIRSANLSDEDDTPAAGFVVVLPPTQLRTVDRSCNSHQSTTCPSAHERCSLLCRFTI